MAKIDMELPVSDSLEGAGGIGGLLAQSAGTSHNYYHADGNGNVTFLMGTNQTLKGWYRYDPFGNTIFAAGTVGQLNTHRFSSKMADLDTGLIYYGERWYDPPLQRWVNRDPINELGFNLVIRSQKQFDLYEEKNLYGFVGNNSVNQFDPLGLCRIEVRCGTVVPGAVHCGLVVDGTEYGIGGDAGQPGAGNSSSGGGASLFIPGGIPPTYANPAGPLSPGQTSYPANCDGSCECIKKKMEDFQKNNPPPPYAAIGPNSNTYAHRMLDAAGCSLNPIPQPPIFVPPGNLIQPPPRTSPPGAIGW